MDALAPAGLIGALVGLLVGWVDSRIVAGVVEGKLRSLDRSVTPDERADFERRIVWFRRLLGAATMGFFPVLGYWLGRAVGG
ncbi:hypothetical protein [Salinarimonas soli]|uniref:Uncharacterized protein n=1 Tax=Salinarimonas soli TaxID=1638099 RepID=A0A5B2VXC1_9HYPH|nr:hypothetical protein [Salinarimonas soli]KAA2243981.1 hypothetical protein F0L46_01665 [Salinarimonas soli]